MIILLLFFESFYNDDDLQFFAPLNEFVVTKSVLASSTREPIRITFDTQYLKTPDSRTCKTVDESITWGGTTYKCQSGDIITDQKVAVIEKTFQNLKEYFGKALKVKRMKDSFTTADWVYYADINQVQVSNTDLHVTVLGRPYGSSYTLASAGSNQIETSERRPIQGMVFMNINRIPNEAENETYCPQKFFQLLFHEMLHVLGISQHKFKDWMDRNTKLPYSSFPSTTLTWGMKNFKIIHTPECHKYAKHRFGKETFTLNSVSCPSGVEFEDSGGSGTRGSHPEGRVYMNEVMVGVLQPNAIITDLSYALLFDTGWYDVDYTMAHGYGWGNGRSLNGELLSSFPLGPPQSAFPSHYLCTPDKTDNVCTYDFKAIGVCSKTTINCASPSSDTEQAFCGTQSFYNPKNYSIRGNSDVHDYMLYILGYSNRVCTSTKSALFYSEESFGPNSRCIFSKKQNKNSCIETRCDGLKLFLKVQNLESECKKEGQDVTIGSYVFTCPNPEYLCRLQQIESYLPPNPFEDSSNPDPTRTISSTPKTNPTQNPDRTTISDPNQNSDQTSQNGSNSTPIILKIMLYVGCFAIFCIAGVASYQYFIKKDTSNDGFGSFVKI